MTAMATERVLVIPTASFRDAGYFQGFASNEHLRWDELLARGPLSYRPRSEMEHDPSFKQLIPYVVFRHRTAAHGISLFAYRRGSGQGERRLHQKLSIGVGGHIALQDDHEDLREAYFQGMRRELDEEVEIATPYQGQMVGMLNDDETEVGRVHLGVVHVLDVERTEVHPREAEMNEAGFVPLEALWPKLDQMESWSQICMQALFPQP